MPAALAALAEQLVPLVRQAGELVMAVYATAFTAGSKADHSPVTLADQQAESLILAGLRVLQPAWPIVAEEAVAGGEVPQVDAATGCFWLVDPLDGTREFISRNGEFTVNIALVQQGRPVLGLVLAPALPGQPLWLGIVGQGAWLDDAQGRRAIACRTVPEAGLDVLGSRSHGDAAALDAYLAGRQVASVASAGSSLKLCLIAQGRADLYPRFGRTMEWDIAAGHAVLAAAGGAVCTLDGAALAYGKPGFENPHFVASGLG